MSLWSGGCFDYVYHLVVYVVEGFLYFVRVFNYCTNFEVLVNLIN